MTTFAGPDDDTPMSLDQFRMALDAALAGYLTSESGATDAMIDLLADVAVSTPGTPERTSAISAARAQFRAEQARASAF